MRRSIPGGSSGNSRRGLGRARGDADPEIPVISLVDLGVIRTSPSTATECASITPTFPGCPALEAMRRCDGGADRRARRRARRRGGPDDSWSTDRITLAGREKLRRAGFAPPAAARRGPRPWCSCSRRRSAVRWCGSTGTRLENIFGPTPCRSIR